MEKVKISAVSYTNSLPFLYGLQHSPILDEIELSLDVPSVCAQKLIDYEVDLGLVPVAALLDIPNYHIISDFCIGAVGAVDSVFIFSQNQIQEIKSLKLDKQSRTSNNLAMVLLKNYWNKEIQVTESASADAFVEIGDRTFGKKTLYPYAYDLAAAWQDFTGLPFAFAVWAANKKLPDQFVKQFNETMRHGVDHREELLKTLPKIEQFDIDKYLMKSIDYNLDDAKRQALKLFHNYVKALPID